MERLTHPRVHVTLPNSDIVVNLWETLERVQWMYHQYRISPAVWTRTILALEELMYNRALNLHVAMVDLFDERRWYFACGWLERHGVRSDIEVINLADDNEPEVVDLVNGAEEETDNFEEIVENIEDVGEFDDDGIDWDALDGIMDLIDNDRLVEDE